MYWIFLYVIGVPSGKTWKDLEKPEFDFLKMLTSHGLEDVSIQILLAEKISSLDDIEFLSN